MENNKKEIEVIEYEAPETAKEKSRIRQAADRVMEFVEDHTEGILMTAFTVPSVIMFGQTIRYMHLLNKAAKKGNFFIGR